MGAVNEVRYKRLQAAISWKTDVQVKEYRQQNTTLECLFRYE
jgi:hypothetical protein